MFANDATVNLNVGYSHLGADVLGQTTVSQTTARVSDVKARLLASGATALDAAAAGHLPTVDPSGAISMVTSGYQYAPGHLGVDTSYQVLDDNDTFNNKLLSVNTANAKALGLGAAGAASDGQIQFSSDFAFDFDPTDGISPGAIDFTAVATHEIGHALGFMSGVDRYDEIGAPSGPSASVLANFPVENTSWGTPLDLFRYSANPNGFAGGGPLLDWSVGADSYFSIDGGQTAFADGHFSTGRFNGDGDQASHWKDNSYFPGAPCGGHSEALGIMDPTFGRCEGGIVTALDLAAFDAIGWNPRVDLLNRPDFRFSTADIYRLANVPEPATWFLMIGGFALAGAALRRRRAAA
jgi:hypothetical protein